MYNSEPYSLPLYSQGITSGINIDIGYSSTRINYMKDGYRSDYLKYPIGGYHLMKLFYESNTGIKYNRESPLVLKYEELAKKITIDEILDENIDLDTLNISKDSVINYFDAFYNPQKYASELGFTHPSTFAEDLNQFLRRIDNFQPDCALLFSGKICETTPNFSLFAENIKKKVELLNNTPISKFSTFPNACYFGGVILASLSTYKSMWVSKYTYECGGCRFYEDDYTYK